MKQNSKSSFWFVYIVRCKNKALYTGITNDLERRIHEHNSKQGGRYTRSFGPVKLLWSEKHPGMSSAMKREIKIKGWTRKEKLALCNFECDTVTIKEKAQRIAEKSHNKIS